MYLARTTFLDKMTSLEYECMKNSKIEHIGISVKNPVDMANWYHEVLGFNIKFSAQDEEKGVAFLTDSGENVMLELGKIPNVLPLSSMMNHHLQLHIALMSEDLEKDAEHLVLNGAKFIEKCPITLPGDELVVLRDPWGNTIQLVKRS